MYAGLATADMINGLGFTVTGIERLQFQFSLVNAYTFPAMRHYQCVFQIGSMLQVVGSQWPALITLGLGLERFFATRYPFTYRYFKIRMFHGLLIASFLISLISISTALYIGIFVESYSKTVFYCNLSNVYGFGYTTFNYFLTMICHTVGFFFNIAAFITVKQTSQKVGFYNSILSKEYRKVKIIFFVSIFSLIMVVLPNFFLYITRFIHGRFDYTILGWVYCLFVLRSVFNLWVIGFGVVEFKIRFFEVFFPCSSPPVNSVSVEDSQNGITQDYISQKKNGKPIFIKVTTIS